MVVLALLEDEANMPLHPPLQTAILPPIMVGEGETKVKWPSVRLEKTGLAFST